MQNQTSNTLVVSALNFIGATLDVFKPLVQLKGRWNHYNNNENGKVRNLP